MNIPKRRTFYCYFCYVLDIGEGVLCGLPVLVREGDEGEVVLLWEGDESELFGIEVMLYGH